MNAAGAEPAGGRRLFLMRHAKSSWDDPKLPDHERPLAKRGRRAAEKMARYMKGEGISPALVLCSSAVRTKQTMEILTSALSEVEMQVEKDLYAAGYSTLLRRLQSIPDRVPSAMLIGHNPGIQELALMLVPPGRDHERLAEKFPTAALADLLVRAESWSQIARDSADLAGYVIPRDLD